MSIKSYPVFARAKRIFLSAFKITQFDPHKIACFALDSRKAIILFRSCESLNSVYISCLRTLNLILYANFLSVSSIIIAYAPEARCPCTIGPS